MCTAQRRFFDVPGIARRRRLDPRAALFLDIDGTLLEIAPRPELVRVPAGLATLIARIAGQRDGALALISGRPLAELDALFQPWHGAAAGLHGIERRRADGMLDRTMDRLSEAALGPIRPELTRFAARDSRLIVEDKGGTIALHYRAAPEREPEILVFRRGAPARGPGAAPDRRAKWSSNSSRQSVNKGLAISRFYARAAVRRAVARVRR